MRPDQRPLRLAAVQLDFIPQALTEQDIWLPAEPLWSAPGRASSPDSVFTVRNVFDPGVSSVPGASAELDKVCTGETGKRLGPIFDFLCGLGADVVVLPEYSVPADCLDLLVDNSAGRVVVAGLGYIRKQETAERLATMDDGFRPDEILGRNVAVLVHDRRVHVVTKRHLAKGERADPGSGHRLFQVRLHGRDRSIGVAICKDFLADARTDLSRLGAEVICVPARSDTIEPFLGDGPRDNVWIVANDAYTGGSTIRVPLPQTEFSELRGTPPAPPGFEVVQAVDFHRMPPKITAHFDEPNRVVCHAQLIDPDDDRLAGPLRRLRSLTGPEAKWIPHLTSIIDDLGASTASSEPVLKAIALCRQYAAAGISAREALRMATQHAPVTAAGRVDGVRRRQVAMVIDWLSRGLTGFPRDGEAKDRYRTLTGPPSPARPRPPARPQATPDRPPSARRPAPPPRPPAPPPAPPAPPAPPPAPPPPPPPAPPVVTLFTLPSGFACLVDEGIAVVPERLVGDRPMTLAAGGGRYTARVGWTTADHELALLTFAGHRGSAPAWGRLVCPDTVVDGTVVFPGLTRPVRVQATAELESRYRLALGLGPEAHGAPVVSDGRCLGFVLDDGQTVLPASTLVRAAWRAGVLTRRPRFATVEFAAEEVPPLADGASVPPVAGFLPEWAASDGDRVYTVGDGFTERQLQGFLHRQAQAGWIVLSTTAAALPDRLPKLLAARSHTLIVAALGDTDPAIVTRALDRHSRLPGESVVRILLRA
ncbi:hypothetical protein [Actinoplanes sp. HUAS TT8]|uniref:hypothetical protein n=1 Tax=Actinoplanes sp. HUAS TT8 TaxID=3447453 RepID=UPI003F5225A6